ncbi:MAG: radical SAM protein [Nitrosarchaeum sp.]|nr:radical SAM protein [Nitrosarchaeum sp.]
MDKIISNSNMVKICSSQFNFQYRNRIHLPYSIGTLVSYIKSKKELESNLYFEKTFVFRNYVDEYIKKSRDCDILLCSCYVWNWEITTYLAKNVKEQNPDCTIIFGGPHVPNNDPEFFAKYPFVDILVHGEGEITLEQILYAYLKDKNYENIEGVETRYFKNPPRIRISDFSSLPSPYLTGIIWELVDKNSNVEWIAAWETLRGCPYGCTFCDWGSATATRMTKFDEEKLIKEIEWFGKNKIPYIDCCDANFGIYQERDMKIATKLKEVAKSTGYPETFHPTFAKFSSEKIIPIAKELQDAGILRAVTLSVQSMDPATLKIIKRENIKFKKFSELTETFDKEGLPTYTEIIMGLPGETISSFKDGLETIISDTKIGSIYIYNCGVFPNAPMAEPSYIQKYKIKKIKSPIFLQHSDINNRGMQEFEEITTGSFSFDIDDIKKMYLYAWLVQTFHNLGIMEYVSNFYNQMYDLKFMDFFDVLLEYCQTQKSIFSDEYLKVKEIINKGYSGHGWNHHDPRLGNILWPIEEASWARLAWDKEVLEKEIHSFLIYFEEKMGKNNPKMVLNDLAKLSVFLLTTRNDNNKIKSAQFNFDWKDFFSNKEKLKKISTTYYYENKVIENDSISWCWKTIFFGRPNQKYKIHLSQLKEKENFLIQK